MSVIDLVNVSKRFYLQPDRPRSFQELVLNTFTRGPRSRGREVLWALSNVSFAVEAGKTLGVVGSNGSGKSTCLKLMARILEPTTGTVAMQGRVSALLELGAGFHPELTGRENIFLYGSVLGVSRRGIRERFEEIVAFAELERFIDVPVKFYSSGMYVRLAFASAINVAPDILLIDEVLAVGDQRFQEKCLDYIRGLRARGVTIVIVSHDLDAVTSLCDRAIWLDAGLLRDDGAVDDVVASYLQDVYGSSQAGPTATLEADVDAIRSRGTEELTSGQAAGGHGLSGAREEKPLPAPESHEEAVGSKPEDEEDPIRRQQRRWGSHEAEILDVSFLDAKGRESQMPATDTPLAIVIRYQAHRRIDNPVFGVAIHREDGVHVSGSNTFLARFDIPYIDGAGEVRYQVDALPLLEGTYYLSAAIHNTDNSVTYDFQKLMHPFQVRLESATPHEGIIHVPARWAHVPRSEKAAEEMGQ